MACARRGLVHGNDKATQFFTLGVEENQRESVPGRYPYSIRSHAALGFGTQILQTIEQLLRLSWRELIGIGVL